MSYDDIEIDTAGTGSDALESLREQHYDCVVLDLRLPDMTGFEVLEEIKRDDALSDVPVVVFTGRELSAEEDAQLHTMARSIVVKGVDRPSGCSTRPRCSCTGSSPTCRPRSSACSSGSTARTRIWSAAPCCWSTTTRATSSRCRSVLERRGMHVLTATTGKEAIEMVEKTPDLAIVLMDIMMPEMDGYQTMGVIRENPAYRRLPIIALTAKAMKGDREKCLEAGASDYLAKPVNTEQLLSALRMWLHR